MLTIARIPRPPHRIWFLELVWHNIMIKTLSLSNFTVFVKATLNFSPCLNVILGENGTGKTHLLKLLYASLAVSWELRHKSGADVPTKAQWQTFLASKLVGVFRPESIGRLARRKQGRERCDVALEFDESELNLSFGFATNSKTEVSIEGLPQAWSDFAPAYLPARELLTIYPGFVSVYEGRYLEFEETWRDTCLLLGVPSLKGPREASAAALLAPLEDAMGGKIVLDANGRFYLRTASGNMEMPLVAEGLRKLGMLAQLIANGTLLDQGYLFWDEPEANLNPRIVRQVASTIVDLALGGTQVFVATHSLFLLREIELLTARSDLANRPEYFGLHRSGAGVVVQQGNSLDDVGEIASLQESLMQSDRYLEMDAL